MKIEIQKRITYHFLLYKVLQKIETTFEISQQRWLFVKCIFYKNELRL